MNVLERLHERHVRARRARVLAGVVAGLLPEGVRVLDIGSGDGEIDAELMRLRRDLKVDGIDIMLRAKTAIPTRHYDGLRIDAPDGTYQWCMLVDVLHHADNPTALLREAARVCSEGIVIKDHLLRGFMAGHTLRFMDRVHNARHGIALPFNYWTPDQWDEQFSLLGLKIDSRVDRLGIYPPWADWVFGRGLHMAARLVKV